MIDAVGRYSALIKGIQVTISATKVVEIRFADYPDSLTDGVRYHITAELKVTYSKDIEPCFRADVLSAIAVDDAEPDYAWYKGIFRINEGAGSIREKQGGDLLFYRGDAFSSELRNVSFDKISGWVTVAVPKAVSAYFYRAGDLLYVEGKVYHKVRDVKGIPFYELCVRAENCHKIDGTEYWERVRAAQHYVKSKEKLELQKSGLL